MALATDYSGLWTRRRFAGALALAAQGDDASVERLTDPVTKRSIVRYASPRHETHHYYFISPWSPDGKQLAFFQFDRNVDKLTARGRYPGALCVMKADGTGRRRLSGTQGLMGHYHVGANQFWSGDGASLYYTDTSARPARLMEASLATGAVKPVDTPVPCGRISPNGDTLSCGTAQEWGVYDVRERRYRRLVTLERALALSPNKDLGRGLASQLQNTRYSPEGERVMIVHRTVDDPPRQIEIFVYDFRSEQLTYLAHNLHHPCWRPDGKAILFVRWDERQRMQNLWEVNVETKVERCVYPRHISCVHASYHPSRQHLVAADCYGGEFGNGLVLVDTREQQARHLVSIPQGAGADEFADDRFPFRNFGLWMPPRKYLNEPRPVWNADGSKVLYTSQESGRMNLYVADTADLRG